MNALVILRTLIILTTFKEVYMFLEGLKLTREVIDSFNDVLTDLSSNLLFAKEKIQTLEDVLKLSKKENCLFKCPFGGKPIKRENSSPEGGGCGAYGIEVPKDLLPKKSMDKCCSEHDKCYDTCQETKVNCDKKFSKCLTTSCKDAKGIDCTLASILFSEATKKLGCKAFLDSQKQACDCVQYHPEL